MTLLIFKYCFLFNWSFLGLQCVSSTVDAVDILRKGAVTEVLWAPEYLKDTAPFKEYMEENYPNVKLRGIEFYTPRHDEVACGWFL